MTAAAPLVAAISGSGELPDSSALLDDPAALRARLDHDGFLLLRGLLPRRRVLEVRTMIVGRMQAAGWLAGASPHPAARPDMPLEGDPRHAQAYRGLIHDPLFAGLAEEPALLRAVAAALGAPALVHRRVIARMAPPHQPPTQPHQDWQYIRGSTATLTAWIPLGGCPRRLGGLAVLPGSHRRGFIEHRRTTGAGGMGVPVPDADAHWLSADFLPGDALLFPALTIHGALANRTVDEVRLSADFRYQRPDEPIDAGSMQPHFGLR